MNHNICCVCGTELLAQYRADVDEDDQWRGPYDHLFPKDKYPIYAIHPDNLLPICHTCNSKAKGAKDLLFDEHKQRRVCFYPYNETAHQLVAVCLEQKDMNLTFRTVLENSDPEIQEKLDTWDSVYRIRQRVDGNFTALIEIVSVDCCADDFKWISATNKIES